ncbi:MAG: CDP-alcohol phosphatidyltransferase family protein [Gemmatimonadota bacterium]|nr:MAG: CDP-alcohol phosphatidyltransferase family protein [Gemmatimonadota bacterium]
MNLPNVITVARTLAAPVIFVLILSEGFGSLLVAFILFLAAAISDIWDGYLARRRGQITDFGKLADPIADKLLVVSTFVPFYIVSLRAPASAVPVVFGWDVLPLWVLIVVLGRELLITVFRGLAKRRGVVIAAGKEGKFKAVFQNMFIGGEILWLALRSCALERAWDTPFWSFWKVFHGSYVMITLTIAVVLTAYSLAVYLWRYRALVARLAE